MAGPLTQGELSEARLFADRYELTERLAAGGTGTVYRARHVALQQDRAVKILHPRRDAPTGETLRQLQLEASVFGRLRGNVNLVMPFEIGFDEPSRSHFLAMELLRGCDLGRWVHLEGPMSVARALTVMRQVAAGLDAAHGYVDATGQRTPIVHRDLTPSNLFLVAPESAAPLVKILDFGLAAVLDRAGGSRQAKTGTALFRSYEQANGLELVAQTDVWALGLVVHFALTGRMYWRHHGASDLHDEITRAPLDPPSLRLAESGAKATLPVGFDAWFLRCLQRLPSRRFPTAGEAIDELELCLRQPEVDVEQPLVERSAQGASPVAGSPWESHSRSVVATEVAEAEPTRTFDAPHDAARSEGMEVAESFHPLLRNVLRVSDDLATATGHYLAFPPSGVEMLARQLDGVAHHVSKYNEARDLLRRRLGSYEGLLRRVHERAALSFYDAAREALSVALAFGERYPVPEPPSASDPLGVFTRECMYWQAERVLLHAQLEVGRLRVRALEREVEQGSWGVQASDAEQSARSLRGAEALHRYSTACAHLATQVHEWLGAPAEGAERRRSAWSLAPAIESMNDAYAALDAEDFALRVGLQGSTDPFAQRVVQGLGAVHDYQWYEFRPLLNGPLVAVIRLVCGGDDDVVASAEEASPRWLRLARSLERASTRFDPRS